MDLYGLVGYRLKHSFSQKYFRERFVSENIDADYINFELDNIEEFPRIIASYSDLRGLNVTLPYKEKVIPYLDDLTDNAREIGAVNVIKFERGSRGSLRLIGHNSDILGFKESIEGMLQPHHTQALILGTGGASKAVRVGLDQLGVGHTFVSRTPEPGQLSYEELDEAVIANHMVIINCTPLGMYPNVDGLPQIPYEHLTKDHLLYDLLYNPDQTSFMIEGRIKSATVKNGLEMLLLQAFYSWDIWKHKV